MPQEPKQRHSKARKRTRRAAIILKTANLVRCKSCNELTLSHQVCKNCGFYMDKKVTENTQVKVTKA